MFLIFKGGVGCLDSTKALNINFIVAIHHDFRNFVITKERLQWSISDNISNDPIQYLLAISPCIKQIFFDQQLIEENLNHLP